MCKELTLTICFIINSKKVDIFFNKNSFKNVILINYDNPIDFLYRIFRVLRTPTEEIWPDCTKLPDFKVTRDREIATRYR